MDSYYTERQIDSDFENCTTDDLDESSPQRRGENSIASLRAGINRYLPDISVMTDTRFKTSAVKRKTSLLL